jgi:hypothetical protein
MKTEKYSIWPKVFINGVEKYTDKKQAIADAYCGWALCMSGESPVKNFGEGMVFIGEYLGNGKCIIMSPEGLDKFCKENNIFPKESYENN